jgi:hypothetical protein
MEAVAVVRVDAAVGCLLGWRIALKGWSRSPGGMRR